MMNLLKQIPVLRGWHLYKRPIITNNFRIYLCTQPPKRVKSFISPKAKQKIAYRQIKDGIPLNYELIYNSYETHVGIQAYSTIFLFVSSICIAILVLKRCPALFKKDAELIEGIILTSIIYSCQFLAIFLAIRFPVRIYHDRATKHYKAVRTSYVPFRTRIFDFTRKNVRQILPREDFPWRYNPLRFCMFKINEVDIYMHEEYFRYPADLVNMLPNEVHWRNID